MFIKIVYFNFFSILLIISAFNVLWLHVVYSVGIIICIACIQYILCYFESTCHFCFSRRFILTVLLLLFYLQHGIGPIVFFVIYLIFKNN